MATPSSPIGFNDIYLEANGVNTPSAISVGRLFGNSYFDGPNGSAAISFNTWGKNKGNNGIFSVANLASTPDKFDSFRNVSYFYGNNSQYSSLWTFDNQCPAQPDYDFIYLFEFRDTTLTYSYCSNGGVVFGNQSTGQLQATNPTTPLIYGLNWYLQVDTNPMYTGDAFVDLTINGNLLMNFVNMANAGPSQEIFDYTTYGNENMRANSPTGLTGSVVDVVFHL